MLSIKVYIGESKNGFEDDREAEFYSIFPRAETARALGYRMRPSLSVGSCGRIFFMMVSFKSCQLRQVNGLIVGMLVRPRVGARARTTTDDRAVLDPNAVGKGFGGIPMGCASIPHGSQRFDAVSWLRVS